MMIKPPSLRTRLAPTPSGYLHIGNAFSFALTATLAKRLGASILLRVDDLDRARIKREYVEDIFNTLTYLGIPWDEGPRNFEEYDAAYRQVYRMHQYEEALNRLQECGEIFACNCSRSTLLRNHPLGYYTGICRHRKLPLNTPGCSWRVNTDDVGLPATIADFIVRKKDGFPSYQLASLVDDVYYGVDLVVRGLDLQESTQAQLYLARLLDYAGFTQATFHHHVLLKSGADEKLSKSAGSTSIRALRNEGVAKEGVYKLIGDHLGLPHAVYDWETLGQAVLASQ